MRALLRFAAAAAGCMAAFGAAADMPPDLTVRYSMSFSGIHIAVVEDRIEFGADGTYRFSSYATAEGIAAVLGHGDVQRLSSGQVDEGALQLLIEEYINDVDGKVRKSNVLREQGSIAIDNEGEQSTVAFEAGAEIADNLTLSYLFYAYPDRAAGDLDVLYIDGKRAKPYVFRRADAPDTITVPAGTFEAVRFEREAEDRLSKFWYIPDLQMIPGRVLIGSLASPIEFLLVGVDAADGTLIAGEPPREGG